MISSLQKIVSPLQAVLGPGKRLKNKEKPKALLPKNVILEKSFPSGFHVYGFAKGPSTDKPILIGAGNPETSQGAVFLSKGGNLPWTKVDLPEETALLSHFVRLSDGRYVAGGMSAIGRGALLVGDSSATKWEPVDLDLHAYSSISALLILPDGSILASTGEMITQGKTKPILFRSQDKGATWQKEEYKLPITLFQSWALDSDGTIYAGTAGDVDPKMYYSKDYGKTWEELPPFPVYKTYKMPAVHLLEDEYGNKRLYVILWGYKTDLADRVVRFYVSSPDFSSWEELPPIEDSHFVFSFHVAQDGMFYIGSEKGRVYRSKDRARSWQRLTEFDTNIGAYAFFEDSQNRIWLGKDFVPPSDFSLWRLVRT